MSTTSPLIGITAEWNPFHAGHSAMIDIIKKAYPQASLIAIMSGAFVQRGEPALFDKWTRAGWAVRSGVDAVFEFPAVYALQRADRFSCHAASMLHAMGVNMIAFGAESLTKDELISAASWAISEDYEHLLHERIADGLSYGEAAHEAMAAASPYLAYEAEQSFGISLHGDDPSKALRHGHPRHSPRHGASRLRDECAA